MNQTVKKLIDLFAFRSQEALFLLFSFLAFLLFNFLFIILFIFLLLDILHLFFLFLLFHLFIFDLFTKHPKWEDNAKASHKRK